MPEIRKYKVTYRDGNSHGSFVDREVKVSAYDAKDAEYQAMIEPHRFVQANASWAYCFPLKVEPVKD